MSRSLRALLDDLVANVADDVLEARLQYGEKTERTRAEILDRYEPAAEKIGRALAADPAAAACSDPDCMCG